LNLMPDDYMDRSSTECSFSLMALDVPPPKGPLFIFGDPFLRRFVTIFDNGNSGGPRVGFAVSNQQGGASKADELIAHVGGGSANTGKAPADGTHQNTVNLHLDAGLMGGDSSDSSSSGSSDDSAASSSDSSAAAPPPPPASQSEGGSDGLADAFAGSADATPAVEAPKPEAADVSSSSTDLYSKPDVTETPSADIAPTAAPADDAETRMKKLFARQSSLLQSKQKGHSQRHMVSIKLHRSK